LPEDKIKELREKTIAASKNLTGDDRVIVYGCDNSLNPTEVADAKVGVVTMPCIGMLPPSFIDFVLSKKLADGVFLTGCREGDCSYRLGIKWTDARLAGQRDPRIRKRVNQDRIGKYWAGMTRRKEFFKELTAFRLRLNKLDSAHLEDQNKTKKNSEIVDA
jgi:coenzyme F420-reducing hydrogenase delta subunit